MAKGKQPDGWRNRILEHGEKPASEFLASHLNWRIHPQAQRNALAGVLDSVGWVQDVVESANSGELLDGHLRVSLALSRGDDTPVPYVRVDVTEQEEALILASLDPLSAMAIADKTKLDELLRQVDVGDQAVQQMLSQLAATAGIIDAVDYDKLMQGMPEFEQEDMAKYILRIYFITEEDVQKFARIIGQNITEKTTFIWFPRQEREPMTESQAHES